MDGALFRRGRGLSRSVPYLRYLIIQFSVMLFEIFSNVTKEVEIVA